METKTNEINIGELKRLNSKCSNCGKILNINNCKNIEKRIGFPDGVNYSKNSRESYILYHFTGCCPICGAWAHLLVYMRIS